MEIYLAIVLGLVVLVLVIGALRAITEGDTMAEVAWASAVKWALIVVLAALVALPVLRGWLS